MALNRSLEFKSLNPKPRSAELFGTLNSEKLYYVILYTKFQASEPSGSETEVFSSYFSMFLYALNPGAPGVRAFWTLRP